MRQVQAGPSRARHVQTDTRAGRERPELDESYTLVSLAKLHRAEVGALLLVEGMPKAQNVVSLAPGPA